MKKVMSLLFCVCMLLSASLALASEKVIVFAAASTTNMMDEIISLYNSTDGNAAGSYTSSGNLARQIEAGAPAAVFISANQQWMDYLDDKNLLEPGTRKNLLGNSLVLIEPAGGNLKLDLEKSPDLVKILNGGKLAIGAPESVPAGSYARQALMKLGMWEGLQNNLAAVENVRVALAFVSRGEAPLGIVFGTDAAADKKVRIAGIFPKNTHEEISYPAALIKGRASDEAKKFYEFLQTSQVRSIYEKYGFTAR